MKLLISGIAVLLICGCTKKAPVTETPAESPVSSESAAGTSPVKCTGQYTFFTVHAEHNDKFNDLIDKLQFMGAKVVERYSFHAISPNTVGYKKPNRGALIRSERPDVFVALSTGKIPMTGLTDLNAFCGSIPGMPDLKGEAFSFGILKRKGDSDSYERSKNEVIGDLGLTEKYGVSTLFTMNVQAASGVFKNSDQIDAYIYNKESKRVAMESDSSFVKRLKQHNDKFTSNFVMLQARPLTVATPPIGSEVSQAVLTADHAKAESDALVSLCVSNLYTALAELYRVMPENFAWDPENLGFQRVQRSKEALLRASGNFSDIAANIDRILGKVSADEKKQIEKRIAEFKSESQELKKRLDKMIAAVEKRQIPKTEEIRQILSKIAEYSSIKDKLSKEKSGAGVNP